ncbi:MAG: thiamine phosphate synthase [Gammaproteobacteria bacterium]|nr:thiamine phosphate synthase [Gammaproteobacteria bacterium]
MNNKHFLSGLYAITDPELMGDELLAKAEQAIIGGINILQYRNKTASKTEQIEEAQILASLCHKHDVLFIINDSVELANEVNADGVHIGQQDTGIQNARKQLGQDKIIGVTCNNKIENAVIAQQQGADYVAFGRFFKSSTKPSAPAAELSILKNIKQLISIPVVAIGGITPANAARLLEYDVDMLAVIESIFGQKDISGSTRQFIDILSHKDDHKVMSDL